MITETEYDPKFVRALFDEMSSTYGLTNLIASLGFTYYWRRKCLAEIQPPKGSTIVDLMAGMGELCCELRKEHPSCTNIIALDNSTAMCRLAKNNSLKHRFHVLEGDALKCPLLSSSVDVIYSTFGLKTFSEAQTSVLAAEVHRILRPGGQFALLEISVPPCLLLRLPFEFYIKYLVPGIGRMFLGNPDNYRMLGVYTSAFHNCRTTGVIFAESGLMLSHRSYFFGCATGIVGYKPIH